MKLYLPEALKGEKELFGVAVVDGTVETDHQVTIQCLKDYYNASEVAPAVAKSGKAAKSAESE